MKVNVILGAGPAGVSCAYELAQHGTAATVIERHDRVGGLCRTIPFQGCRFDIGPHRFFTKNDEVDRLWHAALGDQAVTVARQTRILYRNHLFDYPLRPLAALQGLGLWTSARAMASFARIKLFPERRPPAGNFEDWVVRQFGRVLYDIFFKTYTEKVWGISCRDISAEWAGQRIKGLSLSSALLHSLKRGGATGTGIKSLVDQFDYPRLGAGQAYERLAEQAQRRGADFRFRTSVQEILHDGTRLTAVAVAGPDGGCMRLPAAQVFSSMPLTQFVLRLNPVPPAEVVEAARTLYYRDHLTVNLVVRRRRPFPDNWIYVHDPRVRMARIACYGNFSDGMLADPAQDALSVEYFAFAHDDLWQRDDAELIRLAGAELEQTGLLAAREIAGAFVVRERDSYPVYYLGYRRNLETIRNYLARFANLTPIGRGGMYRYNNQDHAMLSGLLAARNYCHPGARHDLWEINEENEYLEEKQLPLPLHAGPAVVEEVHVVAQD